MSPFEDELAVRVRDVLVKQVERKGLQRWAPTLAVSRDPEDDRIWARVVVTVPAGHPRPTTILHRAWIGLSVANDDRYVALQMGALALGVRKSAIEADCWLPVSRGGRVPRKLKKRMGKRADRMLDGFRARAAP